MILKAPDSGDMFFYFLHYPRYNEETLAVGVCVLQSQPFLQMAFSNV